MRRAALLLAIPALALGVVAAGCGGDSGADAQATTRSAAAAKTNPVTAIASGAAQIAGKVKTCIANRKVGQPCLASDAANIRETLAQVKAVRGEIAANHTHALAEFDRIAALVLESQRAAVEGKLRPMAIHTEKAILGYQALMDCTVTTATTCRPYIGDTDLGPAEPVKEALADTSAYLQRQLKGLPDVPVTASWFTGTQSGAFRNGLATAIWKFNKQGQDSRAGVTNTAVKNSQTVPIVTSWLATTQNRDIGYWRDIFASYGLLSVVKASTAPGVDAETQQRDARSVQAEVNAHIINTQSAGVFGTALHYSLPVLPTQSVALAKGNTAWVVSPAPGAGRPLTPDDIRELAAKANGYSSVTKVAKTAPDTMPPDRWYRVQQPITRRTFTAVGSGCRSRTACPETVYARNVKVAEIALPGARESCTTTMRPTDAPPTQSWRHDATGLVTPGQWDDKGEMPVYAMENGKVKVRNGIQQGYMQDLWYTRAFGPVEYKEWDRRTVINSKGKATSYGYGWGAWVKCQSLQPGSRVNLVMKPAVMGPAVSGP